MEKTWQGRWGGSGVYYIPNKNRLILCDLVRGVNIPERKPPNWGFYT